MQERLHVERVADDGHALGQAAAAVQRVEVVHHEDRAHVVARLLHPAHEVLSVHALVAPLARALEQEVERRGGHERVDGVDAHLLAGVGLLESLERGHGPLVAARDAARDAEHDRGHARVVCGLEGLVVLELGRLRGHGAGTAADGVVEFVGAPRLEEVIVPGEADVGLSGLHIVEGNDAHAKLAGALGREVACGVAHDLADDGHGSSLLAGGPCRRRCRFTKGSGCGRDQWRAPQPSRRSPTSSHSPSRSSRAALASSTLACAASSAS